MSSGRGFENPIENQSDRPSSEADATDGYCNCLAGFLSWKHPHSEELAVPNRACINPIKVHALCGRIGSMCQLFLLALPNRLPFVH
jgi:hypothetical protein